MDTRALCGAVAVGTVMGLVLGASYMAGGAARAAMVHARTERLAAAAGDGFSESALMAETAGMAPGALAVARRHDPFTAAGSAERDRQSALIAARLERPATPNVPAGGLLRASFGAPTAPARPFRVVADSPLAGARELDCLTDAVYYEARGESSEGQAAVAQVVLNRVRHPAFPKSVCGVVYQGAHSRTCQFSFACDGSTRRGKEPVAWRRAQSVAARALSGFVMGEVGNATHFHVAQLGAIWGGGLLRVSQIGAHVFYKFSGRRGAPATFHAANDYDRPSEMADTPVFASRPGGSADGGQPTLILASAVTTQPMSPSVGPAAPQPRNEAVNPAAPAVQAAADTARPATGASSGVADKPSAPANAAPAAKATS